jgi:NAD(P)-dependent dehydrogenase (short-subunit alcohol dehydrogenase family)
MPQQALEGKIVVVTGAGSGIGAAVAKRAAEDGARVALIGRTPDRLGATAEVITGAGGEAFSIRCDVTLQEDIDAAIAQVLERWDTIDGLVNNAGMFSIGHVLDHSREEWQRVIDVDLSAAFFMSQAAGRQMARAGGGSIVNIASIDGHAAEALVPSYSACKAGLMGLTRSMAIDLSPLGIRCNSVSPGYVAGTAMAEDTGDAGRPMAEIMDGSDRSALRRLVTVSEVADACSYLLSDRATGVTGADLLVDGGTMANVYVLESDAETGWSRIQTEAIEEVRRKLAAGEL